MSSPLRGPPALSTSPFGFVSLPRGPPSAGFHRSFCDFFLCVRRKDLAAYRTARLLSGNMLRFNFPILFLAAAFLDQTLSNGLAAPQECATDYGLCSPTGSTNGQIPDIGADLADLYGDILKTLDESAPKANRQLENGSVAMDRDENPNGICCE